MTPEKWRQIINLIWLTIFAAAGLVVVALICLAAGVVAEMILRSVT